MSAGEPPRSVQSRIASSMSVADLETQIAFLRPASQFTRMSPAHSRPLPQPVPSPRK